MNDLSINGTDLDNYIQNDSQDTDPFNGKINQKNKLLTMDGYLWQARLLGLSEGNSREF